MREDCAELNELLFEIRANRSKRNLLIIEKLNALGYAITLEEILEVAGGESVGRPHIASVLVRKGFFKTTQDVFSSCLANGGDGYAKRILPTPQRAIGAIKEAGGISFWAHPAHRNKTTDKNIKSTIQHFLDIGLDGIESYYSEFTVAQQTHLNKLAAELGIPVCGGSDFHGSHQPTIEFAAGRGGLLVPESVYEELLRYYASRPR